MKVDFKKIHFYRKQKKISIYELCIKINIGRTTIWKWEKKKSFPKEIHIRRIAKILNISVSEISDLQSEHPISNINLSNATPTWLEITKSSSHPSAIDFIQLNNILNRLKLKLDNSSLIIRGLMSATYSEVYVKDKNLKYVIANDEFKRTFSLVKNFDFKGKKDKDFFNKQEASKNEAEDMQVLLSGKPISNREGFMPGTRKKKWAIISKLPIFDNSNDIEGIVAVFFNITERKHNEELREQLEINLNNMSESILIYEEDTMNFLYVNKASAKMHGYTFEEFKKMDMPTRKKKYIYPDDSDRVDRYMKDKNFNEILRCRIIKPNGEIRWIESHHSRSKFMSKNCIITVQLDITERHNKIELRKLFEYSINLIQNAFFIIDINANKFLHVNEVVKNIYGYTSDILIEKGLDFWINKCIHTIDKNKILSAYNNNKILPNKYSIISSDGEIKLLESKSFYQHYSGKNCLIIIARDITNYN